ncbi:MAG TPA: DnaJ domain-containing protein [Candidatus Angelobacter sp.]|nr:DnaJ domain-containing protein [Candidatus Angelobacter sp.]
MAKRDYYEILGVSSTATQPEIKSAFENLGMEFHAAGKPKTIDDVEWLRQLKKAYDVLSDAERRDRYDRTGNDASIDTGPTFGYDSAAIERMSQSVDAEIRESHIRLISNEVLNFLFGQR